MKRFQHSVMFVVALLVPTIQLFAQQSSKSVVIHAGHVLDVKTGKLLSNQTLIVENGKIVTVGPSAETKTPGGCSPYRAAQCDRPAGINRRAHAPDHGSQVRL